VRDNLTAMPRVGTMTIAGQTFTVARTKTVLSPNRSASKSPGTYQIRRRVSLVRLDRCLDERKRNPKVPRIVLKNK
jgi:hypothetical protein